ncbi:MAG: hypothetical protein AB1801_17760 [Chloroflexota bacterium]
MLATADPLLAETLRAEADLVLLKPISFNQLRDLTSATPCLPLIDA